MGYINNLYFAVDANYVVSLAKWFIIYFIRIWGESNT